MISSKSLRVFLDDAFDQSQAGKVCLRGTIRGFQSQLRNQIAGGSITSTAANGRHVALANTTDGGAYTTADIMEAWSYLMDMYDTATMELSIAMPNADWTQDAVIYQQMLGLIRPCTGYTNNYMYLAR